MDRDVIKERYPDIYFAPGDFALCQNTEDSNSTP